jgi:catechol 2,3-dioxygenase-like lactoylglutathione lyase family enzyme
MLRSLLLILICSRAAFPQSHSSRPQITGIDHVAFYTTDTRGIEQLYVHTLGLSNAARIESGQIERFMIGQQWVGYTEASDPNSASRMDHIALTTTDVEALRRLLRAAGVRVPDQALKHLDGSCSFLVQDPEGNRIEFVQRSNEQRSTPPSAAVSHRLIHAGFTVRDRAVEDKFYKDLLGFNLYWHGGMQPDRTDWVAMQVPDGTDWLEYMLNQPEHLDLRRNGVMDHISLGVRDMKQAQAMLESHGWKESQPEHSQMGKDGKWQLNLFDPDLTRIELMEFTPKEKPCCSEFQGPHPTE